MSVTAQPTESAPASSGRLDLCARAVLIALMTVSVCCHIAEIGSAWSASMGLTCAALAFAIWRVPNAIWTRAFLALFAIGVAARHSLRTLQDGVSCGCFGPDLSAMVELYLVSLFLVAAATALGTRPKRREET